jgi:short subunit dehydrogenase-like uncharacterized protein
MSFEESGPFLMSALEKVEGVMKEYRWMIYGATGRSGQLIARRAVEQGLRPILAGRNAKAVQKISQELNLSWRAFEIGDWETFRREASKINLLVNAAGPFMQSSVLIAEQCLAAHTHYFDLSNEVPSLVAAYTLDGAAKEKDLTLLPGLAFSPAASNCLIKHLHTLLPDADSLDIALEPFMRSESVGANLTMVESIAGGGFRRRGGTLERCWTGNKLIQVALPTGMRMLVPAALGDVEAAYRCTNIPNITTHIVTDIPVAPFRSQEEESPSKDRPPHGESVAERNPNNGGANGKPHPRQSLVWARMSKIGQSSLEGWLYLGEGYEFTAAVVVAGVSQLFHKRGLSTGAHTPASALGADFILDLPNVERRIKPLNKIVM